MEKVYAKSKGWLAKLWLLLAVLGMNVGYASAQTGATADDPFILEDGGSYDVSGFTFKAVYATFTAPSEGTLTLTYYNTSLLSVYTDATYTEMAEQQTTNTGFAPMVSDLKVEGGKTYYFHAGFLMNADHFDVQFVGGGVDVSLVDVAPSTEEPLSATSGIVTLNFNRGIVVGGATLNAGEASVAVTPEATGSSVIFNLSEQLMSWYGDGTIEEGSEVTLTLSNISPMDPSAKMVVEDGVCSVTYKVAACPVQLQSSENTPGNGMDVFYSYILSEKGNVTLVFDGDLSSSAIPTAQLLYGSGDREDDYYTENLEVQKVDNRTLRVSLGGKQRMHKDMYTGTITGYFPIQLKISGVKGADGQYAYSGDLTSPGAFSFTYEYEEVPEVGAFGEFTPAAGETITGGESLELYIFGEAGLNYDGISFSYVQNGGTRVMTVPMDEVEKVTDPDDPEAVTLKLTVPNLATDEGTQVTVSLNNLEAIDGFDYSSALSAAFDYVQGETTALVIVNSTPAEGTVLESLSNVSVQTNMDASVGCMMMSIFDLNPTNPDEACIQPNDFMTKGEDGFSYELFFAATLYEGHDYEITFTAYPSNMDAQQGVNAMGSVTMTIKGGTKAFQYSPVTLVSVTPDPSEGFASVEDNTVTATFSGPVEITPETAFISLGYGMSSPFESITSNEDKTVWTFVVSEADMRGGNVVMLSVAVKDADGLVVMGNTGEENDSYFEWSYSTFFNAPNLVVEPSNEEALETLSEVIISVEDGVTPIAVSYTSMEQIVVWNMFQETVATGTVEPIIPEEQQDAYDAGIYQPVAVKVTFDNEITEGGRYTLHIPEGYFMLGEQYTAVLSKATNVIYSLEGVKLPLVPASVQPEDGATVESLDKVTLTMDCDLVTLLAVGEDADAFITVTNKATGEEVDVVATVDDLDWDNWVNMNQVVIRFSEPITESGTYVLTIAPELFADDQWDPMFGSGTANAELTYEFTVKGGDSVSSINVEEGKVTVYTLNGVQVLKDADRDALKTLKKGIYIVNGEKVVVK